MVKWKKQLEGNISPLGCCVRAGRGRGSEIEILIDEGNEVKKGN
jgi:hypothetical protein